jgi:hypothetical protein
MTRAEPAQSRIINNYCQVSRRRAYSRTGVGSGGCMAALPAVLIHCRSAAACHVRDFRPDLNTMADGRVSVACAACLSSHLESASVLAMLHQARPSELGSLMFHAGSFARYSLNQLDLPRFRHPGPHRTHNYEKRQQF